MICMRDLSAQFDHHFNKYTMCTVQNDQESIAAHLVIGAFRPSGHLAHTPCPCGTRLNSPAQPTTL